MVLGLSHQDILKKIKGEWVLVSKVSNRVLRKFGKTKPSDETVSKAERQIKFFESRNDGIVQQLVQQKQIEAKGRKVRIGKQPRQRGPKRIEQEYNKWFKRRYISIR